MPFKVLFGNGYKAAEDLGAYIILCILKGSKLNCCEIADVCACTIIMLLIYFCYLSVDVVFSCVSQCLHLENEEATKVFRFSHIV